MKHKRETLGNKFKKVDIFGSKINLTFKGGHSYQTKFGATMTFVVAFIVLYAAAVGFVEQYTSRILSI